MTRYEITVDGTVGPLVLGALEGFEEGPAAPGCSRLVGDVADQAALHGCLNRLHDLRVEILEMHRLNDR